MTGDGAYPGARITAGPRHWQILQQVDGYASVAIEGTWSVGTDETVAPGPVYIRAVREEDGGEVIPWMPCVMHSERRWDAVLARLPAGGPYRIESCLRRDPTIGIEWAARGDMIHHVGVGDLWLIAGQSNAVGYGRGPIYDPPELGVHLLRHDGAWDLASHPLNDATASIYPANRDDANPGHSPFLAFARVIRRATGRPVGLLMAARGGSPLAAWDVEDDGYLTRNMLRIVTDAGGRVHGILWYQGESDTTPSAAPSYLARFARTVAAWRTLLNDAALPILTVQLNRLAVEQDWGATDEGWGWVRDAQRRAAGVIAKVYVVPALDAPLSDSIHTSPTGNILIGERLARLALAVVYGQQEPSMAPTIAAATSDSPPGALVGTIDLRFDGVRGYLLAHTPDQPVFVVEDERGILPIAHWAVVSSDRIRLTLDRRPVGATRVHGAPGRDPLGALPVDTGTYLPMLAFHDVAVVP